MIILYEQASCKERRKILVVKFIMVITYEIAKVNHQIQASGMSCNLREVNFSCLGWIKRKLKNATNWDKEAIV